MLLEGDTHPITAAVNLKTLPFWPADPQACFVQVEAQFSSEGITAQKTKFDHIVASLLSEFAQEVRDLIPSLPTANPYDKIKKKLLQRTAAFEQHHLQQLFNSEELGDRKTTQLLRHMQQLLGDKACATDINFLCELFLQRLPANVCIVLATHNLQGYCSFSLCRPIMVRNHSPQEIGGITRSY